MSESAVRDAVERTFAPEFRNRLDKIVTFNALDEGIVLQIVDKEILFFASQLAEKNVEIEVSETCRKWIAREGFSNEFGARNVARLVQDKIKAYFVDEVLFGELSEGGRALVDMKGDEIAVKVIEKPAAAEETANEIEENNADADSAETGAPDVAAADSETGDG